jgi:hypothetical protein
VVDAVETDVLDGGEVAVFHQEPMRSDSNLANVSRVVAGRFRNGITDSLQSPRLSHLATAGKADPNTSSK